MSVTEGLLFGASPISAQNGLLVAFAMIAIDALLYDTTSISGLKYLLVEVHAVRAALVRLLARNCSCALVI